MLDSACFEALTAACPLGAYILPSLPTELNKLWRILPGLHDVGPDKIHHSSGRDLLFPFKQRSNKVTFSLARFIKVFVISLLLAAFPFSCLVHLFGLSFTEIPGVPSTTFLLAIASSLLLFPTQPLDSHYAATRVSSYIFWFYFPSSKISLFLTFHPPLTPPLMKIPLPVFSTKPRLARSESPVLGSPQRSPSPRVPAGSATDSGGCSLERNQSHLPVRHEGWWHSPWLKLCLC